MSQQNFKQLTYTSCTFFVQFQMRFHLCVNPYSSVSGYITMETGPDIECLVFCPQLPSSLNSPLGGEKGANISGVDYSISGLDNYIKGR